MKNNIKTILEKAIGYNIQKSSIAYLTNPVQYPKTNSQEYVDGYNDSKAELQAKIPAIQDAIVGEINNLVWHRNDEGVAEIEDGVWYIKKDELINHLTK
jgi:hypothetical protein